MCINMKKIILISIFLIILTGCNPNGKSMLTACQKTETGTTEATEKPDFSEPKKLQYSYIIDGRQYSDRLITGNEQGSFDFLKLLNVFGVENSISAGEIKLSYMDVEMSMLPDDNGIYSVYYKDKKLDLGVNPYKKDNSIYIKEDEIKNLKSDEKIPLSAKVFEDAKTVHVSLGGLSSSVSEPEMYFDLIEYKGQKTTLTYKDETIAIKVGETEYEKNVGEGYIDGRIIETKDAKTDVAIHLWDGNKIETILLKLG